MIGSLFVNVVQYLNAYIITNRAISFILYFSAFITYRRSENIESVFKSRPHMIGGTKIDVKRAVPKEFVSVHKK